MTRYEVKTHSGTVHTVAADRFSYEPQAGTVTFQRDRRALADPGGIPGQVVLCDVVAVYAVTEYVREVPGDQVRLSPENWLSAARAGYAEYVRAMGGPPGQDPEQAWARLDPFEQNAWKHAAAGTAAMLGAGAEDELA